VEAAWSLLGAEWFVLEPFQDADYDIMSKVIRVQAIQAVNLADFFTSPLADQRQESLDEALLVTGNSLLIKPDGSTRFARRGAWFGRVGWGPWRSHGEILPVMSDGKRPVGESQLLGRKTT
jgi:hypothetical protein